MEMAHRILLHEMVSSVLNYVSCIMIYLALLSLVAMQMQPSWSGSNHTKETNLWGANRMAQVNIPEEGNARPLGKNALSKTKLVIS
jgi:hypothetical protein